VQRGNAAEENSSVFSLNRMRYSCLHCFDTVGWAAERASGLCKIGDGGGGHLVRMEWRPAGWSVCLPLAISLHLYHKVHKFSSDTGSPGWSRKKGRKTVVVVILLQYLEMARQRDGADNITENTSI